MKIEPLNLTEDAELEILPERNPSFWKRQFEIETTEAQRSFDWVYGVWVPLLCVVADPIVFRNGGILGNYRPFAYLLSSVSIVSMVAWLLWGKRVGWLGAPIGGLFIAGSFISLIVGVTLLPYSVFGLLIAIGFLGFTPLFSALVYLRNGIRALNASGMALEKRVVWQSAVLAGMLALIIPYIVNVQISRMVTKVVTGDVSTMRTESAKLRYVRPLVDAGAIQRRYYEAQNAGESQKMRELDRIHQELTGKSAEHFY
ncbi:MAG TPA: hypothetical protein VNA22_03450 [Pyrinomonadaceae bacterium]|nr:hypothetical protein [Pyrinomonadaceae bacterium]